MKHLSDWLQKELRLNRASLLNFRDSREDLFSSERYSTGDLPEKNGGHKSQVQEEDYVAFIHCEASALEDLLLSTGGDCG